MHQLNWLLQHRFVRLTQREHDWVFAFDGSTEIVVESLWRFIENECIRLTSRDHGQQFGLPSPVDAIAQVNAELNDTVVTAVDFRDGTLDLRLSFNTGHIVEIIPDSSGFEAWSIITPARQYVAVGGELVVYKDQT